MKKVYVISDGSIKTYYLINETEKTFKVRSVEYKWFETRVMKEGRGFPSYSAQFSVLCPIKAVEIANEQIRLIDEAIGKQLHSLCKKRLELDNFANEEY